MKKERQQNIKEKIKIKNRKERKEQKQLNQRK